MTKYDERESNDSVGDERLRRVKPRIRLRPPLSLSALCPRPRLISFLFPSLFLFFVSFFRVFHFLNASFRRSNTFFYFSDRTMGLAQIALVAHCENRKEREREKSTGEEIYTGSLINPAVQLYIYFSIDTV